LESCKEELFAGVQDPRNPNLILYSLNSLLFAGTFLFVCRLGSRREIQAKLRRNGPAQDKFGGLFGIARIPHGDTLFYHPVLEAKLVTLTGFAFSLMTEFIENADLSADKQDCELKAFYRLAKRLKARFPRLAICLLLDGLFAGGPTFKIAEEYGWKYLIVLREDDLPNVHRSYATVLPHLPENDKEVCLGKKGQLVQEYHWAENLAYTDTQNCQHSLNLIECLERQPNPQGQIQPLHYKWLTNFTLTSHNVDCVANQGGRLRWKIENEGFNVQTNSDLNLEHIYSADPSASNVFYLLMQLACILFQLMEKMQLAPGGLPQGLGRRQGSGFPSPGSLAQSRHRGRRTVAPVRRKFPDPLQFLLTY